MSPVSAGPKLRSLQGLLLMAIFLIALILRVEVARHLPSIERPDEIFNTLEPAHRLAYGYGVVVWEWREGIRSWAFPGFLAAIMRATDWMGSGSLGYLTAIVIILSLLSLTSVWFGYAWAKRASGKAAAVIAAAGCAFWYQLVYFGPKAFNEVAATAFLLPGLYLGMYAEEPGEKKRLFLAGLFVGAAVALRLQLAPAVAFAVLYFCHKRWASRAPALLGGVLVIVIASGLLDAFTWSYPFQSYIRYVQANVGRSSRYGIEPWYWYTTKLAKSLWPMLLLALAGVRRNAFLGWVVLIIVGSHSVIAHKEFRFVYPVIPILITLAALGFVEIVSVLAAMRKATLSPRATVFAGLLLFTLSSGIFARGFFRWGVGAGGLIALDRLSRDPSVCAVGLYQLPWDLTGGYVHLHRNIPILLTNPNFNLDRQMLNFNAMLTLGPLADPKMGFQNRGCWNGVCLYRRSGPCLNSPPFYEVNKMLVLSDQ
jgi:hypothetical protein